MESTPSSENPRRFSLSDILFAPIGCLIQSSPLFVFLVILVAGAIGSIVFYSTNTDFWGLTAPDFEHFTVSDNFQTIQGTEEQTWKISYEFAGATQFSGLVRHVSPIRMGKFPMLTHDILVTSGDFADSSLVRTNVSNHHFTWFCDSGTQPRGTINLLHTVPASEEIYEQLLQIRSGDQVAISGREILRIDSLKPDGSSDGWWQDSGCNTLLVNTVEILAEK